MQRQVGVGRWWEARWLWLALATLSSLPFMVAPVPPMPDLHSHIGRYYVMLHAGEPDLARYYSFKWQLISNLGVDLIVDLVGRAIDVETSARIVVGCIPFLTVIGLYALSRAASARVAPTAFLALPLVWSFPFSFGFVNFSLGVALALLLSALWIHSRERRALLWVPLGMIAGFTMWICHLAAFGIFLVIVGCFEVSVILRDPTKATASRSIGRLAVLAWPTALMALFHGGPTGETLFLPTLKLGMFSHLIRNSSRPVDGGITTILLVSATFLVGLAIRSRSSIKSPLTLASFVLFLVFGIMPYELFGSFFADLRLLPAALMLLFLGADDLPERLKTPFVVGALAMFALQLSVLTVDWADRTKSLQLELLALQSVPMGSRIAVFAPQSQCVGWPFANFNHLPSRAIPRRRAFVTSEWDIPGANPLRPTYNLGRGYNDTSSTMMSLAARPRCFGKSIDSLLAALPRDRFDFVWAFDTADRHEPWLRLVYRGPEGRLYAVR